MSNFSEIKLKFRTRVLPNMRSYRVSVDQSGSKGLTWTKRATGLGYPRHPHGLPGKRFSYRLLSLLCHVLSREAAENAGRPEKALSRRRSSIPEGMCLRFVRWCLQVDTRFVSLYEDLYWL